MRLRFCRRRPVLSLTPIGVHRLSRRWSPAEYRRLERGRCSQEKRYVVDSSCRYGRSSCGTFGAVGAVRFSATIEDSITGAVEKVRAAHLPACTSGPSGTAERGS